MFRKIVFLIISIFQEISLPQKSILLIFFSFSNFLLIIYCAPYVIREFNQLEYRSNIAALVTLYCGSLYLEVDNDSMKAFLFVAILITNIAFSFIWLTNMLKLQIIVHFDKIKKYAPKFLASCMSISHISDFDEKLPSNPLRMLAAFLMRYKENYQRFREEFMEKQVRVENIKAYPNNYMI